MAREAPRTAPSATLAQLLNRLCSSPRSHSCPNDGPFELAHSGVPAVLHTYGLYSPDDNEQLDNATRELLATLEANFSLALQNLALDNLTHPDVGLRWWVACPRLRSSAAVPQSASVHLNAYGVWLVEELAGLLEETGREVCGNCECSEYLFVAWLLV